MRTEIFRSFRARVRAGVLLALPIAALAVAPMAAAQNRMFSPGDAAVVANALIAANGGNAAVALSLRTRTQDVAAQKLIAWYVFTRRDARADFGEVTAFLRANPHWPMPEAIVRTADRSITPQTSAALLLQWFADRLPLTGEGLMDALAALKAQGKAAEATALLRRSWASIRLTDTEEAEIVKRHGAELRGEDHAARIGYLASLGHKRVAAALLARTAALDPASRAIAEARLKLRDESLRGRPAEVEAALAKVPDAEKAKEGFAYDLMRWHRRGNRHAAALAIADTMPAKLEYPEHVWKEFDILIRNAIAARQFDAAYRLAANHRQPGGETRAEAEFLAGYIAFRLLDKPDLAEKHFAASAKVKVGGWDEARLAYWTARLVEARGDKVKAAEHYNAAMRFSGTFYGQLAAARLGRRELVLDAATGGAPQEKFWDDEIVRAAHLLRAAGDARAARLMAIRAAWNGGWSVAQHNYLAKFVLDATAPDWREQTTVRLAKLATRDGATIASYGFPTLDLPEANVVEPALVFAVIRQESEFLAHVKSHAGARGLMQLMPFTAKFEAKEAKLRYDLNRLTADPAYNLRLGTQHLQRLSDYYQGAYPLMVAAYNAGAGRVDRWLATHGDPRQGKTEWADWIELIPFEETRLYTKYVLENHAIYRVRLGDTLDLPKIASHWTAPRSDAEVCRLLLMSKEFADLAPIPLAGAAPAPGNPKARVAKRKIASAASPEAKSADTKKDDKKKGDAIELLKKEKPDNMAATPSC